MPYDICEDEPTLDYIESEMARRGVTQELIDQTRASTERQMLTDLKVLFAPIQDLLFLRQKLWRNSSKVGIRLIVSDLSVILFRQNSKWQPEEKVWSSGTTSEPHRCT